MNADLVVDASVLVDALIDPGDHGTSARAALRDTYIAGPEHLRVETCHALRTLALRGIFAADTVRLAAEHLGVDLLSRDSALHTASGATCTVRSP